MSHPVIAPHMRCLSPQALDWRREAAAAAAERDHLLAEKRSLLPRRASSGAISLYAGYNGGTTPKARGEGHHGLLSALYLALMCPGAPVLFENFEDLCFVPRQWAKGVTMYGA